MKKILAVFLVAASVLLSACGGKSTVPSVVALALDGPPLALAGEYAGMALEGEMARTVMAGKGVLTLGAPGTDFDCRAEFNAMPSNKGRVRGLLVCSGERRLPVSLRNIGPDQGIGIARETPEGELMVFFYHPSKEEAERRLPETQEDIARARAMRD